MTRTPELRLAKNLALPLEVITEATAIVATRGAGKSSASAVVVEEAFAAGVQAVVFDRTGVYWGLRSSKSGDGPGLGIYVLGGPHGDVPLQTHAGALIADLAVDSGHSFVLDLSDFSKASAIRFAADFMERLYDRKARSRSTTLVVLDEAHFYAPQTPRGGFKGDSARLMGAMEDVVGLGRSRGLGVVLTTQRTQALNKAILDLIETLLVMRMLSPRARDAVQDWIREKHEDDREGVVGTLESLPTGTAWVWSPLRGVLTKVAVRRIRTFDSYYTPAPGQTRVEPSTRKQLDIAALGEQIAKTAEEAKAQNPVELRKRIRELEAALSSAEARKPEPERVEVEIPAVPEGAVGQLQEALRRVNELDEPATLIRSLQDGALGAIEQALHAHGIEVDYPVGGPPVFKATGDVKIAFRSDGRASDRSSRPEGVRPRGGGPSDDRRAASPPTSSPSANGDRPALKHGAERMLRSAASLHPMWLTRPQLGALAKVKASGGTFSSYLSALRTAGLVEEDGPRVRASQAGFDHLGEDVPAPATAEEILALWRPRLKAGAERMLDVLLDAHPDGLSRDELAERAGVTSSGGTFSSYLSMLRTAHLIDEVDGEVRAGGVLFIGARA